MGKPITVRFRLYVAGDAPNSLLAKANLSVLCQQHFPDQHEIVIVDVIAQPERALADNVLVTPMLMKLAPDPVHTIFGNLSDTATVLRVAGLSVTKHE